MMTCACGSVPCIMLVASKITVTWNSENSVGLLGDSERSCNDVMMTSCIYGEHQLDYISVKLGALVNCKH